jgi:hypothetical protein
MPGVATPGMTGMREPLIHFLLIGALLFALGHYVNPVGGPSPPIGLKSNVQGFNSSIERVQDRSFPMFNCDEKIAKGVYDYGFE